MRLIVQIPCFNEAETLPRTVAEIPKRIAGFDSVEILVVDDGSTDATSEVARRIGVDHVVRHRRNRGLAEAFRTGVDRCLRLGADVIVNTDADNQYPGSDIAKLVAPIREGSADVVIGDRRPAELPHFSRTKRLLQRLGSATVRRLSRTNVPDAVSGFRAFSRDAGLRLNVVNSFSYTIETVMQMGDRRLAIASVPVGANRVDRRSRLFRSVPQFLRESATILMRTYLMYRPLNVFVALGAAVSAVGLLPVLRFLYFYVTDGGQGHIQSLVLGSALLCIGFMTLVLGLLADLIACNRRLIEITLEKVRRIELSAEAAAPRRPTTGSLVTPHVARRRLASRDRERDVEHGETVAVGEAAVPPFED